MKAFKLIITNLILIFSLVILTSGEVYADNEFSITYEVDLETGMYFNVLKLNNGKTFKDIHSDIEFYYGQKQTPELILKRVSNGRFFEYEGASILALSDDNKIRIPNGLFFVGQEIDLKYKDENENDLQSKVTILVNDSYEEPYEINVNGKITNGKYYIEFTDVDFAEIQNIGWKYIYITENVSGKDAEIDLTEGVNPVITSDSIGISILNNNTIQVPEAAAYEVTFIASELAIEEHTVNMMDNSIFIPSLEKVGVDYRFVFKDTLSNLEVINGNNLFTIKVMDLNGNIIGSIDSAGRALGFLWYYPINSNVLELGDGENDIGTKLRNFNEIVVNVFCTQTGLDESVTLQVPKLDDEIVAEIIGPGTLEFYAVESGGNKINIKVGDAFIMYGYNDATNYKAELSYEANGTQIIQTINSLYTLYPASNEMSFSNISILKGLDFSDLTEEQLNAIGIPFMQYYNAIVANNNQDIELFLNIGDLNGNYKRVKINTPSNGVYPYFEAITGLTFSEAEQIVADLNAIINANVTFIDEDTLIVSAEKNYQDFVIPESAIYYIYEENSGRAGNLIDIENYRFNSNNGGPIPFAGVLIGGEQDGFALGEYIYYDFESGNYTTGENSTYANCFPLSNASVYRIYNYNQDAVFKFVKVIDPEKTLELVEIIDATHIAQYTANTEIIPAIIYYEEFSLFQSLQEMIARFILSLANGLNYLVQMALQSDASQYVIQSIFNNQAVQNIETIDIDSIIFNHYPDTSIAFFNSNTGSGEGSKMIQMFRDGIEKWYSVFRGIAIAGYLLILLYIGIKVLVGASAKQKSKHKEMLTSWCLGIVILMFFPYVIRYAIEINNVFVALIENSKSGVLNITDVNSIIDMSAFSLPTVADEEDYEKFGAQMEKNPYSSQDTGYMAFMARRAHKTLDIVDAIVYLIMVWQFISIVILYYKRVFIIAFLIAIFPFVALSYALDKIGDGKAQAFNTWTKEIMVNIFIQTIHAIIYVFVIGATYVGGSYTGDWLLSIIGITFLFKGEQIIKKIIGQDSSTTKNLVETATKTVATIQVAKSVAQKIGDNFVGSNSHLGRAITYGRMSKAERKIADNMDFLGYKRENPKPQLRTSLSNYDSTVASTTPDYDDTADAVAIFNNRANTNNTRELGKAIDTLLRAKNSGNANLENLLKDLNISRQQLDMIECFEEDLVEEIADGDTSTSKRTKRLTERIDSEMEVKLRILFPGISDRDLGVMKHAMLSLLVRGDRNRKHKKRAITRSEVMAEHSAALAKRDGFLVEKRDLSGALVNPFVEATKAVQPDPTVVARTNSILSVYYKPIAGATSFADAYTAEQREMARHLALIEDISLTSKGMGSGTSYTAKQAMESALYLVKHENDSPEFKTAIKTVLNVNAVEASKILADAVGKNYTNTAPGHESQFRRAIRAGAGMKDIHATGTVIEKRLKEESALEGYEMALETIDMDRDNKVHYGRLGPTPSYEASIDVVDVDDISKQDSTGVTTDEMVRAIIEQRRDRNIDEAIKIERLAMEQLRTMPAPDEYSEEPMFNGLTEEEHKRKASALKKKQYEELLRFGTTTTGVTLGGIMGAGISIGLNDSDSAVSEAFTGAIAGSGVGDTVAEKVMGKENTANIKKVKIINPYTGQPAEFELKTEGLTADLIEVDGISDNEILRYDDPRLTPFKYNLERQYLDDKQKVAKRIESERKKKLYEDALK